MTEHWEKFSDQINILNVRIFQQPVNIWGRLEVKAWPGEVQGEFGGAKIASNR